MIIAGMVIGPMMIALEPKGLRDAITLFVKTSAMALRQIFWKENPLLKKKLMILIHEKIITKC